MRAFLKALLRVALVSLCVAPAFAIDPVEMSDPVLQERYRNLSHELRCMQCQNQSIADSPVGLAGDLRREVRQLLEEGKTDQEIRQHMRDRYGDFILFRPEFTARNAWLWITPVLLLLIGIGVAIRIIRQRVTLAPSDASDPDDVGQNGASQR